MNASNLERRHFYRSLFVLVMPIALQNLINTAVSSADVIMLGYVSQTALSAGSLANQFQFILNLFFSGMTSGVIMLAAQYWGKGDLVSIENLLGIGLKISVTVGFCFSAAACIFPNFLMLIFTSDPELIEAGASYLRSVGISYLFMSISQVYLSVMKSIERVKISTIISSSSLVINIFLNATFIFGLFGAPKMGIIGVGVATTIARIIELLLCVADAFRQNVIRLNPVHVFRKNRLLFQDFIRYSGPALGNEIVWGVAFSMYSVIMGHLGSDIVAANSVVTVARNLGTILCFGIANGGAILLGKEIGNNQMELAKRDAKSLCWVTFASGLLGTVVILLVKPLILNMADLTDTAYGYLNIMIYINSVYVIGQAMNTSLICGIFRAGGDSRYGFICDIIDMWCFSVPLGFLCAFVFRLPVMVVYVILCLDEFVKMPFIFFHYKSYRWLKNITRDFSENTEVASPSNPEITE
ncbi:MAG: MATE family efflux transporter [Massiliimalia sp.]